MGASKREKNLSDCDAKKTVAPSDAQLVTSPITLSYRKQGGHESPRSSTGRLDFPQHERIQHNRRTEVFQDTKVHVGGGNIMSYRWITRATARPGHNGSVLEATVALSTSREAMGLAVNRNEDFLLIILPDLLMTMDSMESRLGGILELNPHGRLLLVSHYVVAPVGASASRTLKYQNDRINKSAHHGNDEFNQICIEVKTYRVCFSLEIIQPYAHLLSWANVSCS